MSRYWSGIALPWGVTISSVIDPKDDKDEIKSSVMWIVLTAIGERVMNPEFGSKLPLTLFEPSDLDTVNQVKESVKNAIRKYDNRVKYVDFTVKVQENKMICSLAYKFATDPFHDSTSVLEFTLNENMLVS